MAIFKNTNFLWFAEQLRLQLNSFRDEFLHQKLPSLSPV